MNTIVNAVEYLEKAIGELYGLKIEAEIMEKQDLVESLEEYIESIQSIIDEMTDDEIFVSRPKEE